MEYQIDPMLMLMNHSYGQVVCDSKEDTFLSSVYFLSFLFEKETFAKAQVSRQERESNCFLCSLGRGNNYYKQIMQTNYANKSSSKPKVVESEGILGFRVCNRPLFRV